MVCGCSRILTNAIARPNAAKRESFNTSMAIDLFYLTKMTGPNVSDNLGLGPKFSADQNFHDRTFLWPNHCSTTFQKVHKTKFLPFESYIRVV